MPEPLALLVYERLLPGGQLVNQLQDRGYRVHTLSDPSKLAMTAETEKPMLVVVDVSAQTDKIFSEITRLKSSGSTSHIPVIAVAPANNGELQERARTAGAKLVVSDNAIVAHLDQFLEQALEV